MRKTWAGVVVGFLGWTLAAPPPASAQDARDEEPAEQPVPAAPDPATEAPVPGSTSADTAAASDTPPATASTGESPPPDEADAFYKGDLGTPGAPELLNPHDAFFIGLGYFNIGGLLGQHYARLKPSLDLHLDVTPYKQLTVRLEGPVNVLLYDRNSDAKNHGLGTLRRADYNEPGDYTKLIKQIQFGRKEDKLYVNVGLTHGVSLGHGTVMRRYNANLDRDRSRLGAQLDAYNDYGGFETFIADLAWQTRVVGALGFVKPMAFLTDNLVARTWSVGVHYTSDLAAPRRLLRDPPSSPGLPGRVRVDRGGYPRYEATHLGIVGVDSEIKPLKLGNLVDLKLYADYSHIQGAGGGTTGGFLLRSNAGSRPSLSAFRVRVEGRLYDANYAPNYFDSLYEVQKFQYVRRTPTGLEPTKYEAIVENNSPTGKASAYVEASYALVDKLVLGVGLERLLDTNERYNLLVHVEVPAFEFLRLYASYQKFGFKNLGDAFKRAPGGSFRFEPDAVLFSQARLMVLPFLFVSGGIKQTFQWDADFRTPEDGIVVGAYRPQLDYLAEVELGWEFN